MFNRNSVAKFRFATLLFISSITVWAQTDLSTIRGTVTDPAGGAVPGAAIRLVETNTNIERTTASDQAGNFEMPYLPRGTYRMELSKPGFTIFNADNILLESSQIRRINVKLEVGSTSSAINVKEDAAVIEAESSKVSGSLTQQRYLQTPLTGANLVPWYLLSALPNMQSPMGSETYRVAGQPAMQAEYTVDGIPNGGRGVIITTAVSFEDVEELKLTAVNNSAEFSRVGSYNTVTRGGTNDVHGRIFYLMENEVFDARPSNASVKVRNRTFTYGGNVGGPVVIPGLYNGHNRTFFYVGYSGENLPSHSFYTNDVPTSAMRAGDFSQLLGLAKPTVIIDPTTGTPFPGNVIPAGRLNPMSINFQTTFVPQANFGGTNQLTGNLRWIFPHPSDIESAQIPAGRIDHKLRSNNTLSGKLTFARWPYTLAGNWPASYWTRLRHQYSAMISDTHIFTPKLINEFRWGLHRESWTDGAAYKGADVIQQLGLQGIPNPPSGYGFPTMSISGYASFTIGGTGGAWIYRPMTFADSMTYATGRHILKFGVEHRRYFNFNGGIPGGSFGTYSMNGSFSGNSYADFLLGLPFSSSRVTPLLNRYLNSSETGLYVQDAFKVSSRLTLDYGLRWEVFPPASYQDGLQYNWDPATGNVIVPPDKLSQVSPLYPKNINVVGGQVLYNSDKRNFAPRLGFAYRPFANTVIRGGYGIFSEYLGYNIFAQTGGPFQVSDTYFNQIINGQPLFQFPNPFPAGTGTVASQSVAGYPLNESNGRIQQFNFTIERQFGDIGLRASYIGSRDHGLNYSLNINKPQPSLVKFSASRNPYPQFVSTAYDFVGGNAKYDALQIEGQRKTGSFVFDAHWTFSNSMTDTLDLENPYHQRYYNRDTIPRHRVVASITWMVPVGKGRKFLNTTPSLVDAILGGWTFNLLSYMQTGQYFTPSYSGFDASNTNTLSGLPDRIANGNLPTDGRSIAHWFDTSAFVTPAAGRFGNSGVNVLQGPGLNDQNIAVSKGFKITERFKGDFVWTISDVFNHPNYSFPRANISVPGQPGTITDLYGIYQGGVERAAYRQMEVRLRISF